MRIVEEEWLTVSFNILEERRQKATPEGLPLFAPNGEPETERVTVLRLTRQTPSEKYSIRFAMDDGGRRELATALGGGVVMPGVGDISRFSPGNGGI